MKQFLHLAFSILHTPRMHSTKSVSVYNYVYIALAVHEEPLESDHSMSCNNSLSFMSRFWVLAGSGCHFVVHELHFPPHHCHFGAIHHSREWVEGWSDVQCRELVSSLIHFSYVVIINDVAHFFPTTVNNPVMAIKWQGVSVKL